MTDDPLDMPDNGDRRPRWLLRKLALISRARAAKYGPPPENTDEWWSQIVVVAAELQLEVELHDFEAWR